MQRFTLGSATITVFNVGDIRADLAEWFGLNADDWPQYCELLAQPIAVPMNSTHIALGDASVVIDAPRWSQSLGEEFLLPGYSPPPDLPTQLRAAGIDPAAVTHVVITHLHFDHFNGLAHASGEGDVGGALTFPNAWHYIGRADWDRDEVREALRDERSMNSRTLGLVHARDQLMRVTGDLPIAPGIDILAAPGETPGHQVVRVRSNREALYCIGDLVHHEIELTQPEWQVFWADAAANQASRARILGAARAEQAFLVAGHIRARFS